MRPNLEVAVKALLAEMPWLERLARRRHTDTNLVDDLIQQVWLRALKRPPTKLEPPAVRAWLASVMRSVERDRLRQEARRARREVLAFEEPAAPETPEQTAARLSEFRSVERALAMLNEPLRRAVELRYLQELSSPEIAEREGVSRVLARQRVSRGLRELRERLAGDGSAAGFASVISSLMAGLLRPRSVMAGALVLSSSVVLLLVVRGREGSSTSEPATVPPGTLVSREPLAGMEVSSVTRTPIPVEIQEVIQDEVLRRRSAATESLGIATIDDAVVDEDTGQTLHAAARFGKHGEIWSRRGHEVTILVGASGKFREPEEDTEYPPGQVWFVTFVDEGDGTTKLRSRAWPPAGFRSSHPLPRSEELFGLRLAVIGDLNHDSIPEIAVCAPRTPGSGGSLDGAVWILFPGPDDRIESWKRLSVDSPALAELDGVGAEFGSGLAGVGDRDGDGVPDMVVSGVGFEGRRGGLWLLSLTSTGDAKALRRIALPGLGLEPGDQLGFDLCSLGDIDGDGGIAVAVGVPWSDEFGVDAGALWILSLDPAGHLEALRKIHFRVPAYMPQAGCTTLGARVSSVGDLDGNGIPELFLSFEGKSLLVYFDAQARIRGVGSWPFYEGAFAVLQGDHGAVTGVIGRPSEVGGRGALYVQSLRKEVVPVEVEETVLGPEER